MILPIFFRFLRLASDLRYEPFFDEADYAAFEMVKELPDQVLLTYQEKE